MKIGKVKRERESKKKEEKKGTGIGISNKVESFVESPPVDGLLNGMQSVDC